MNYSTLTYRFAGVAAILGAAVSANAWILGFGGNYANPNTNNEILTFNYKFSDLLGNNYTINTVHYNYLPGISSSGYLVATSNVALGRLNVDFSGGDVTAGGTHTMSGIWTANVLPAHTFSGTTANTKLTGTYSASFDGIGDYNFTFVGQPVPEPASMGILVIGIGGIIFRRRKKA